MTIPAEIKIEVLATAEQVSQRAAALIAAEARLAVKARGRFLLATSGGTTPARMLALLANEDVPFANLHLFQVDERIAAANDPARNYLQLQSNLLQHAAIPTGQVYPMPVEDPDADAATWRYVQTLAQVAGNPPVLDLVHLGLGVDGHTASLLPGDPNLNATSDVAVSGIYQGYRRLTLTFPVLARARKILWVVTGSDKAQALAQLLAKDNAIPATHVATGRAMILADTAAAADSGRWIERR